MTATAVRNTGVTTAQGGVAVQSPRRSTFRLSNGNTLIVVHDTNSAATGGWGDNTGVGKIYVYERPAGDTTTPAVLRATIAAPTGGIGYVTAALFGNNDLGILVRGTPSQSLRFCKLTYSGYGVSAWETVATTTAFYGFFDMDISDSGCPIVGFMETQSGGGSTTLFKVAIRTTGGSWVVNQQRSMVHAGGAYVRQTAGETVSVCALDATGSSRRVMMAWGETYSLGGVLYQSGIILDGGKIDETTGAISGWDLREAYTLDVNKTGAPGQRTTQLWHTGTNEWTLAMASVSGAREAAVYRGTYDGTTDIQTHSCTRTLLWSDSSVPAFTYDAGVVNISCASAYDNLIRNRTAKIIGTNWVFSAPMFFSDSTLPVANMGSGTNRNFTTGLHEIGVQYQWGSNYMIQLLQAAVDTRPGNLSLITTTVPSAANVVSEKNPALMAYLTGAPSVTQARTKVQWQFATNNTFTSSLIDYVSPDTEYADKSGANASVPFSDVLPSGFALNNGTWYFRARMVSELGVVGPWTATQVLNVDVTRLGAYPQSPNGQVVPFGSGNLTFSWGLIDPQGDDTQTAYQIQIMKDGTVVHDTGKTAGTAQTATFAVSGTQKTFSLSWKVRVWDASDVPGAYSEEAFFSTYDAPTVTINSPAAGATLTTGAPTITFTGTVGDGRQFREYIVTILQAGQVVWSSGRVYGIFASGTPISRKVDSRVLGNNQSYSIDVQLVDSVGMVAQSSPRTFSVAWVPPMKPNGLAIDDTSFYNEAGYGYVSITWDDANREDPAFVCWEVYRKDDLPAYSPYGPVVKEGEFKLVYRDFEVGAYYEFRDYFAPSGYKSTYEVKQVVNRDGNEIESTDNDTIVSYQNSDAYWLLEPISNNTDVAAERLHLVTSDTFTEEKEEAEFTVAGRGRVVNRGDTLGPKGTLEIKLRNTGGTTARQKRLRLLELQESGKSLYLRNPFGDVFLINPGAMSVTRLAGTGKSEFCDVTIPYSEVVQ